MYINGSMVYCGITAVNDKYGVAKSCLWTSDYGVMGEVGNYRVQNPAEVSSSAGGLSTSMNLASAPSSSSRFMPTIPETGNDDRVNGREYDAAAFHHDSWNESSFNNLKRNRDGDMKMFSDFNGMGNQVATSLFIRFARYPFLSIVN